MPTNDTSDLVQVVLSDCTSDDAGTVLSALGSAFASGRSSDTPGGGPDAGSDTWTESFVAASDASGSLSGTGLKGAVTAELQGTPVAVDRLRKALTSAFTVEEQGSASGDQEVELQLRLTARDA
ncbi:hypothetical protein GCM10010329_43950 [Streptomyces spiroverticillatus]|uniref:Uncharacterized protein n=1 Tax=Streptomyces finlayi TaxID=67296 RepID=A0A919CB98_9ACTN|nr:hypothetical protein [Streptomyces finlayi]GHA16290.1 hypothetical protein GCM10010329_43950 [Streptomyces spiroverticillatus]GHC98603.1 hypothetical protein GCM10010334_41130 [Streptomyces finlayi]